MEQTRHREFTYFLDVKLNFISLFVDTVMLLCNFRSVTGSEEQIKSSMTSLQEVGFINYYGMQRFGTSSIPTHHIGR